MKNQIIFVFVLTLLAITVIACSDDNEVTNETTNENFIVALPGPQGVDLIISNPNTDVVLTTLNCGFQTPIFDVSCSTGQRSFNATATITNIGTTNLPAGSLTVDWIDASPTLSRTFSVTYSHGMIQAWGGTFQVMRAYPSFGPCNCPPPTSYFIHSLSLKVDPGNLIPELNDNNNGTFLTALCNDC